MMWDDGPRFMAIGFATGAFVLRIEPRAASRPKASIPYRGRCNVIVGGYSMDLYCDGKPCRKTAAIQNEFYGQTYTDCSRQAKRAGWRLNRRTGTAYCTKDCK